MDTKLKGYFEKNNIKSVIFDMDSTLVDTNPYYISRIKEILLTFTKEIYPKEDESKQKDIVKEILLLAREIHRKGGTPRLINELTLEAIQKYIEEEKIEYSSERLDTLRITVDKYFEEFYQQSPVIFSATVDILHLIEKTGTPIGIYSHAQKEWTDIKVRYIKDEYFKRYNKEIQLPFFTTPISESKNGDGWILAANHFGFRLEETLVVGDNFFSDIEPAILGGCKNLIHISNTPLEYNNTQQVNLQTFSNISDIFSNI